jgi:flagellar basal body-associated protein FliL
MKQIVDRSVKKLLILYRLLLAVLIALALIILGGTLYALILRPSPAPPQGASRESPAESDRIFTGIGRIRSVTADPEPSTVILSVAFPYIPEDRAFSEELASRVGELRRITADYLRSLSADELRRLAEGDIKAELLNRYNAHLRLGNIEVLYFSDFMILD